MYKRGNRESVCGREWEEDAYAYVPVLTIKGPSWCMYTEIRGTSGLTGARTLA